MGRKPHFCQGHFHPSDPSWKKVGEYENSFIGIYAFKMQVTQESTQCFQVVSHVIPSLLLFAPKLQTYCRPSVTKTESAMWE